MFPSIESAGRRFASLHRVLRGEFPCFDGTIKALRLPAAPPAALRCLRLAVPRWHSFGSLLRRMSAPPEAWSWSPCGSRRDGPRKRQELPSSWGTPIVRLPMFSRLRRDCPRQTITARQRGPWYPKSKGSHERSLKLNSMAFGLAAGTVRSMVSFVVEVTPHHARLASGRWSGATGRAFHPQGSNERFQISLRSSHPPFPSFLEQSDRPRSRIYSDRADRCVQGMAQNLDFGNLTMRLFGKFRRLVLAVKDYRTPATGKPV
jgi:hypothetical protein